MKKLKIYYGVARADLERVAINLLHAGMDENLVREVLVPRLRALLKSNGGLGVCNLNDNISQSIETTNKACDIVQSIVQRPDHIAIEFSMDVNIVIAGIQLAAKKHYEEKSNGCRSHGYLNSLACFVEVVTDGEILSALTDELFMRGEFRIMGSATRGTPKSEDDPFYRGTDFYILDMLEARAKAANFQYLPVYEKVE